MSLALPASVRGFHDYFKLTADPRELTEAFGYVFETEALSLAVASDPLPWLDDLQQRLTYAIRRLTFDSETPRREFLIAPLLFEVSRHLNIPVRSEYSIQATPQLKGTLDYLLQSQKSLLVVEAKQSDLTRGFSQLVSELIALDHWSDSSAAQLYGVVSYGEVWRFGCLNRASKTITQDVKLFTLTDETEVLARTLIAILRETPKPQTESHAS
jgi:hypothetical protein